MSVPDRFEEKNSRIEDHVDSMNDFEVGTGVVVGDSLVVVATFVGEVLSACVVVIPFIVICLQKNENESGNV
jgi:hypothetical protein